MQNSSWHAAHRKSTSELFVNALQSKDDDIIACATEGLKALGFDNADQIEVIKNLVKPIIASFAEPKSVSSASLLTIHQLAKLCPSVVITETLVSRQLVRLYSDTLQKSDQLVELIEKTVAQNVEVRIRCHRF